MRKPPMIWMFAILSSFALACGGDEESADEPIVIDQSGGEEPDDPPADPPEDRELVISEVSCTTDADCVADGCCHPAACTSADNAPSCGDVSCTADCQGGTMDCGGGCLCHEGRCAAHIVGVPPIGPISPTE